MRARCRGVILEMTDIDGGTYRGEFRREQIAEYFDANGHECVQTIAGVATAVRLPLRPKHYPPKKGRAARGYLRAILGAK